MQRSTWITLGVFALLLGLWFVQSRKPAVTGPVPLSIDGYIGIVSEEEARTAAKNKPMPFDKISLSRKGEAFALERLPVEGTPTTADGKPAEAKWKLTRTADGKSSSAGGQAFRAQAMGETLQRSIRSNHAQPVTAAQLNEYGLDPDHVIDAEWAGKSGSVKLRIGLLQKPERGEGESNTWVMNPKQPDVAYLIAGRDLRTNFDVKWADLRERQLLTLDMAAVDSIEIENPADLKAKKIVAKRAPLGPGEKREGKEGWGIVEPAGTETGDIGDWLGAIGRFSANDFMADASKLDTGLDDAKSVVKVTVGAGAQKTVILFGKVDNRNESKDFFARIVGRDETYLVASNSRDQIAQTLDQVRNRLLFGTRKVKDIQSFTIKGPDTQVVAVRKGDNWQLTTPAADAGQKAIETLLTELEAVKIDFNVTEKVEAMGLATPAWQMTLQFGGETVVLQLGDEKDGNEFARLVVAGVPSDCFKLTTWAVQKLKKKPDELMEKPAPVEQPK